MRYKISYDTRHLEEAFLKDELERLIYIINDYEYDSFVHGEPISKLFELASFIKRGFLLAFINIINYNVHQNFCIYPNNLIVQYYNGVPVKKFFIAGNGRMQGRYLPKNYRKEVFGIDKAEIEEMLGEPVYDPELWYEFCNELLNNYKNFPSKEDVVALYNAVKLTVNL